MFNPINLEFGAGMLVAYLIQNKKFYFPKGSLILGIILFIAAGAADMKHSYYISWFRFLSFGTSGAFLMFVDSSLAEIVTALSFGNNCSNFSELIFSLSAFVVTMIDNFPSANF